MSEHAPPPDSPPPGSSPPASPPAATVRARLDRHWRLSLIWAIPIVTALIGLWLAWHTLSQRGPMIRITFETAEGLVAGQSHVRHKDVDMGTVQQVVLSRDLQNVVVTVQMSRESEPLLTDQTKFWVVKPRFFAGAVSGLETLVSGAYIEMLPSPKGGDSRRDFTGLETPPVLQSDVPGRTFLLKASRIGSLNLGSPVFFRDLTVGEVLGWDIGDMAETVTIHAFVRAPYDQYVHDTSRFWNASGATLSLGANGVQLQLESWRALVLGGIAFETPNQGQGSPVSGAGHAFPLYPSKDAADAATYGRRVPCVAYLTGSVAGLGAGAAVTLRGIRIGEVASVALQYDKRTDSVVVPVYFELEPGRIEQLQLPPDGEFDAEMGRLVQRGLRVQVNSASLITGQKQLAIDLFPEAPPAQLTKQGDTYVIPVAPGSSGDLAGAAGALVAKLEAIPFDQIGQSLAQTLSGASGLVNDPKLHDSVASLQTTLAGAQSLVQRLNSATDPLLRRLPAMAQELDEAVRKLNSLAGSVNRGYGGNSEFNRDANRLLAQLTDTARSFRVLADLLSRHPEALIRGRTDQGSP